MEQVFGMLDGRGLAEEVALEPHAGCGCPAAGFDALQEFVHRERLGHEVDGAGAHQPDRLVDLAIARDEEEGRRVRLLGEFVENRLAGNIRQADVADDEIERVRGRRDCRRWPRAPTATRSPRQPSSSSRWTIDPPMTGSSSTRPIRARSGGMGLGVLPVEGNCQRDRRPSASFGAILARSAEFVNHAADHPEAEATPGAHRRTGVLVDENRPRCRPAFPVPGRQSRSASRPSLLRRRQTKPSRLPA